MAEFQGLMFGFSGKLWMNKTFPDKTNMEEIFILHQFNMREEWLMTKFPLITCTTLVALAFRLW
jgi:hypothetical protein